MVRFCALTACAFALATSSASADCVRLNQTLGERLSTTQLVFVGDVLKIDTVILDPEPFVYRIRFRVLEAFKGTRAGEQTFDFTAASEDYKFNVAQRVLVFAHGNAPKFSTSVCSDTREVQPDDKELVELRRLVAAPAALAAPGNLGTYEERIAVEDVMARYVWAVDSFDAEGYVAVFTDDGVIDSNGTISKGHDEIRKIVTNLTRRRDDNKAKGLPAANLYHMVSNVRITFPKRGEALHQSYWQTVRRNSDGTMIAAAMGRSEDRLVKRNGHWLIQSRKLTVFTD